MLAVFDRRRPPLPGEKMPPPALTHGENSPTLPYVVSTYRGVQRGWEPIRTFSDRAQADRFATLVQRIRADYLTRTIGV